MADIVGHQLRFLGKCLVTLFTRLLFRSLTVDVFLRPGDCVSKLAVLFVVSIVAT